MNEADGSEGQKYLSTTEELSLVFREFILPSISRWCRSNFKTIRDFFLADAEEAMQRPIDTREGRMGYHHFCKSYALEIDCPSRELSEKIKQILEDGPSKERDVEIYR